MLLSSSDSKFLLQYSEIGILLCWLMLGGSYRKTDFFRIWQTCTG